MQSAQKIAAGGIVILGAKGSKSTRTGIVMKRRRLSTAVKNFFIVRKFICRFSVLIIYFNSDFSIIREYDENRGGECGEHEIEYS